MRALGMTKEAGVVALLREWCQIQWGLWGATDHGYGWVPGTGAGGLSGLEEPSTVGVCCLLLFAALPTGSTDRPPGAISVAASLVLLERVHTEVASVNRDPMDDQQLLRCSPCVGDRRHGAAEWWIVDAHPWTRLTGLASPLSNIPVTLDTFSAVVDVPVCIYISYT
ncbi:predicted protein [Histoplasma capsulatum G186AR]|uniref:Uncharacterized protein n=1 Tax=Ajellomyces capsulatus (strain G186AR / H82 / ATCC MYA-2454 / RMSCC 2432) TaxID=447093 RepID=C0NBD9_AJECG|nr:uncharacterized protein HCBG_00435 [Histoplasma capsulatum G186AR]EEH10980.1 predicted protein [Histoplasma capsulatum G186AR]